MAGRGLGTDTLALIETIRSFLEILQPHTVRGCAYQLFNQQRIAEMSKAEVGRVSRVLTTARERGMIPWEWIVDETREVERTQAWSDPASYADTVMYAYKRDWWGDQPERIMVISEKGTVGGLLRPVLREYRVPFLVLHGFSSATALNDLAALSVDDPRPLTLLYVGDHDPSGRNMSDSDVPGRLERYGGNADVIRLAVTPDQIARFALPTFSVHEKRQDPRYREFLKIHGETCCELDALDPNTVRDLVEGAITERIDWDRWNAARADECGEQETIRASIQTLKEMTWL
jgi:hypothetical protein